MRGTQSAGRGRGFRLCPLLAGSCAAVALFSGGCVDDPKRAESGGAAGVAGAARAGAAGGGAGGVSIEAGAGGAKVEAEAGAGGAAADAGMGGEPGSGLGGDTGGAQAGSAGEGGQIDTFNEPCPSSALDGWASVAGLELDPASNQLTAVDVSVSNATDLLTYAASPDPYIIHVSGTIAVPVLDVSSNKTIIGDDRSATIEGGIRIAGTSTAPADMVSNVVIKNLRINAYGSTTAATAVDSDGIGVAYAHHVWIDHVDIGDTPGDSIDITNGSDYVTVSWSQFRFEQTVRGTGVRVGHSDANSAEDSGRLKVTLHHNWWTDSLDQRMPRVRFGDVHVFDNYFSHTTGVNSYCVAAALESRLLVENNYFDQVQNPHVFFSFDNTTQTAAFSEPTAEMVVNGNTYVGIADSPDGKQSGQGSAFVPPYSATLEPADTRLKEFVRHCTGPR